jgi:hypothetical protein
MVKKIKAAWHSKTKKENKSSLAIKDLTRTKRPIIR